MASFCVESLGINRLIDLSEAEIASRLRLLAIKANNTRVPPLRLDVYER